MCSAPWNRWGKECPLPSWLQTGITVFMISDRCFPNLFYKTSNRIISSTSDKLLSFHRSDTSGLERWSGWSGHTSPADLTTFPHSRRNYKLGNLGFSARFWKKQFSRGCLALSPEDLTLVLLSCGPSPFSHFFRCLSSHYHPAHPSHLYITVTSVTQGDLWGYRDGNSRVYSLCPLPSRYHWLVLLASNQRLLFQNDFAEMATAKAQLFMNLPVWTRMCALVFRTS